MTENVSTEKSAGGRRFVSYLQIARPDHWFKNVFMLFGFIVALFYAPDLFHSVLTFRFGLHLCAAFVSACLVASSNYVINEILDAPTDRSHPVKKMRPIPSGRCRAAVCYAEWLLLAAIGLFMARQISLHFFCSVLALWIMGVIYNVRPVRSKELPYLDVLSESVNNPLRLLMGWYILPMNTVPPVSLVISYWMVGAFFMAAKRWAEYRQINDAVRAGEYRRSFKWYTPDRLMISMFFYSVACALFLGIFIVRYHVELILSTPLIAGFFAYYLKIAFMENSPVQAPEHLYKQTGLMIYLVLCVVVFFGLMFVHIPELQKLLNFQQTQLPVLWTI